MLGVERANGVEGQVADGWAHAVTMMSARLCRETAARATKATLRVMPNEANEVEAFFASVWGAALLLPDGWFGGRPMEGQHELSFTRRLRKRLLVELDDQMLLSFSGEVVATRTTTHYGRLDGNPTLVISGFRQCVIDFLEYGSDRPRLFSYAEGSVSFVGTGYRPTGR